MKTTKEIKGSECLLQTHKAKQKYDNKKWYSEEELSFIDYELGKLEVSIKTSEIYLNLRNKIKQMLLKRSDE